MKVTEERHETSSKFGLSQQTTANRVIENQCKTHPQPSEVSTNVEYPNTVKRTGTTYLFIRNGREIVDDLGATAEQRQVEAAFSYLPCFHIHAEKQETLLKLNRIMIHTNRFRLHN